MSLYYDDFDYDDDCQNNRTYTTARKAAKIANDPTKHYPNKDEAQALRKIMSSTGLSEKEVRADKKYRKQLSEAQKSGEKSKHTPQEKWCYMIARKACKTTGLPREHPETIKILNELLVEANKRGGYYGRTWIWESMPTTVEKVFRYCKLYAKN